MHACVRACVCVGDSLLSHIQTFVFFLGVRLYCSLDPVQNRIMGWRKKIQLSHGATPEQNLDFILCNTILSHVRYFVLSQHCDPFEKPCDVKRHWVLTWRLPIPALLRQLALLVSSLSHLNSSLPMPSKAQSWCAPEYKYTDIMSQRFMTWSIL